MLKRLLVKDVQFNFPRLSISVQEWEKDEGVLGYILPCHRAAAIRYSRGQELALSADFKLKPSCT